MDGQDSTFRLKQFVVLSWNWFFDQSAYKLTNLVKILNLVVTGWRQWIALAIGSWCTFWRWDLIDLWVWVRVNYVLFWSIWIITYYCKYDMVILDISGSRAWWDIIQMVICWRSRCTGGIFRGFFGHLVSLFLYNNIDNYFNSFIISIKNRYFDTKLF